jgi:hypothetical protein
MKTDHSTSLPLAAMDADAVFDETPLLGTLPEEFCLLHFVDGAGFRPRIKNRSLN